MNDTSARKNAGKTAARKPAKPAARKQAPASRKQPPKKRFSFLALIYLAIAVVLIADIALVLRGPSADPAVSPAADPAATPTPASAATATATAAPSPTPTQAPTEAPTALPIDLTAFTAGGHEVTGSEPPAQLPYQIHISKKTFTIAVLAVDDNGEYTRLMRTYRAATGTGNKTRKGTYTISKKYDWYAWSLGGFTPYTCAMADSKIRLHAPLHNENEDFNSLWNGGYQEIGTEATQGCIRTTSEGAAWVYYNCDIGTEMVVGNDDLYTSDDPPALDKKATRDPTVPESDEDLEIPVTFFTMQADQVTLKPGETLSLAPAAVWPENTSTDAFLYTSGQPSVATVDENGLLTACGEGVARVLVMANDIGRVYRYVEVTVLPSL